ncbi:F-box/LRR-repeat protein At3g48880-like [Diospyros lotus]|uniref:F-box/LRR-repeat protein At3g48880-like n=1 Tax=Diospyros lotus TaxID=55363 RepID=UPI0022504741|nr:F-box/LRR-repeat protein At3g48880-like [Diospyros lotus]
MERDASIVRQWGDMDINILLKIFLLLDVFDLTSSIAQVCYKWRLAARDPLVWRTLDLSMLKSNFVEIPSNPYVYIDNDADETLKRVLKISLKLSMGSIETIILHSNLYIDEDELIYAAERSPKLKRLVMPSWTGTRIGICKAIQMWSDLELMTTRSITPTYLMKEISQSCKNFSKLKIMGPVSIFFASAIVAFLPGLKVLSLRCSRITKKALIIILEGLANLEVLNISHAILIESPPPPAPKIELKELDHSILEKASRLREFLTCSKNKCNLCCSTRNDKDFFGWSMYQEGTWKEDELKSFAL